MQRPAGRLKPPSLKTDGRQDRKTDRQDAIVQSLRAAIVGGALAPGSRLPNRVELETSFASSSVTVQKALERLKDEGFVTASRRNGTFVALRPPHLSHYALIFPGHPAEPMFNRFWAALCSEAVKLEKSGTVRVPIYYGVDGHEDSEDYQRLLRALATNRLAGMIFANQPDVLRHSPLFEKGSVPAVAISAGSCIPGLPLLSLSQESFRDRALESLATLGCRRIAVFKTSRSVEFAEAIAQRGLSTQPYWIQDISLWDPATSRGVAHLLMNKKQLERPDGIVVTDDNLLESVTQGLVDAGVRVPQDVQIVSHCNFPYQTNASLPVTRIGFDTPAVLARCVGLVDAQRNNEAVASDTDIMAHTEAELAGMGKQQLAGSTATV